MFDAFGRQIDYLRISVTDRCNLRCQYCMPENAKFLPRSKILSLDEIAIIAERFIGHGIRKIRLTGGEPLVRRDMMQVVERLGRHVKSGELDELTMTTNGTLLKSYANDLAKNGIKRINVSLDTLNPQRFHKITRGGKVADILEGIAAANAVGIHIKINMVALKDTSQREVLQMAEFCAKNGYTLSIIEQMPLGEVHRGHHQSHIKAADFVAPVQSKYKITPSTYKSAGPARYYDVQPIGLKLGLITPLSRNFCDGCNRLRLTTEGKIYMCLGHDSHVDLRKALHERGISAVDDLLKEALKLKPLRHDFNAQLDGSSKIMERHMNVTGG